MENLNAISVVLVVIAVLLGIGLLLELIALIFYLSGTNMLLGTGTLPPPRPVKPPLSTHTPPMPTCKPPKPTCKPPMSLEEQIDVVKAVASDINQKGILRGIIKSIAKDEAQKCRQ